MRGRPTEAWRQLRDAGLSRVILAFCQSDPKTAYEILKTLNVLERKYDQRRIIAVDPGTVRRQLRKLELLGHLISREEPSRRGRIRTVQVFQTSPQGLRRLHIQRNST